MAAGKAVASLNPIYGRAKLLLLLAGLASKSDAGPPRWAKAARIDRLPGFTAFDRGGTLQTTALAFESGTITALCTVRNPDKPHRVEALLAND